MTYPELDALASGQLTRKDARPRRRSSEREDARKEILQAVKRLHSAGGYEAVTMRSVAKEVGLSAMSLYRYFPNKAALLEEVWAGLLEGALKASRMADAVEAPPLQRLKDLYTSYINFWLERPQDFRLLFDPCCEIPSRLVASGPALGFRQEAEALIDACMGPNAQPHERQTAYDLCRVKVIGYLYTSITLEIKPHCSTNHLLSALLDDIERQLCRS